MQIPRLHPDTIEEVKQRVDIVDVVSEHVVLRKRGKDYVGLCPFHDEKTPSFSVSPSKQMYYCFGCNAGGNAIKFLMEVGKSSFSEVVLDLARRYQVPVQTLEPAQRQELQRQLSLREQLYEILAIACQFYQHALRQPQGEAALEYLQSSRKLSLATIQQFGLGYAPTSWETLYRYLVEQKNYPVQLLEQAGLIRQRQSGDGYYDYFRDRLMIPIHDIQARVIGFGGRTLGDEQPKYLNSPETQLFNKGKTLFALDQAKSTISHTDQAVVVEGYFDAMALHAAGITNAVASLGTALSLDQVRQLLRYTESKQLILNFDADAAGTQAAERAIGEIANLAYRGEVSLRILNLPEGKDADEYLHTYTPEHYRELLQNAPLWLDWQIQQLVGNRDLKQADQFQQVAQKMVKLLKLIDNSDTRNHYVFRCAELLSLGDSRLIPIQAESLLSQVAPVHNTRTSQPFKKQRQKTSAFPLTSDRSLLEQAEALLLRIYLHCSEHRQAITEALQARDLQFSLSHHRFLWQQILTETADDELANSLVSRLQTRYLQLDREMTLVSHLFYLDEKTEHDLLRATQGVQAAIACMERVMCEKRYRLYLELWQDTDPQTDFERSQSYYELLYTEQRRLQELDRQRQFSLTDLI
ncbi:DNA primase [Gloeocapsopsis dulcis]|uniref:DNA primase n=1 Tax=Gloeocapsopsis dulcis AAB1 = 1H9 TaxID=1433147 RepID=A0A6N8FTZ4_9CHRO|nr:DNA primase [Gloeocapsopsis dulcis]MUL35416.1 DNA primase [Gloeocapsopsis dulcis AAB1 = 1H9]WNN90386.1 DNA primase [Gloeocapsopsis dulcis]